MRLFIVSLLALIISACGNNSTAPVPAPVQAPPPAPIAGPGGPSGQATGGPNGPTFQPQMPQGYPPQYYPFLPIDNYMRSSPQRAQYWTSFWGSWQGYAQDRGYDQYDFTRFWYEYCPQRWNTGRQSRFYGDFNRNYYAWASPQTRFAGNVDGSYFWANYVDTSFSFSGSVSFGWDY